MPYPGGWYLSYKAENKSESDGAGYSDPPVQLIKLKAENEQDALIEAKDKFRKIMLKEYYSYHLFDASIIYKIQFKFSELTEEP